MDPSNSSSSSSERRRRTTTTSLTSSRGSLSWFMVLSFIVLPVAASVIFYGLDPSNPAPYPKLLRRPTHSPRFVDGHILGQLPDVVGSGQVSGPEDIAYDRVNGWIYTGCLDGWIKRVDVTNGSSVEPVVNTGGRPLGLALSRGGKDGAEAELYIADAVKGLLKLSKEGDAVLLSNEAEGQQFKLTDGVDVADDGTVYFTDASFKYGVEDSSIDVLEARPHGRLLSFHPTTGDTIVLLKELYFPNGVALSPDQTSLIFCETTLRRCSRYHIKGSRAGTLDPFTDNIPGMPDNIHYDGQANYWIAIFASFPPFLMNMIEHPFVRKVLLIMNNYGVLSTVLKDAGFLVVDLQGNQVAHLFDPTLLGVTSGLRIGPHLYSGSLHAPHILRFNLHQSHYPNPMNV